MILTIAFTRTVTFKRGSSGSGSSILHSLLPVGFSRVFIYEIMNYFLPGCLFAVVVIKCFMIGVNV